MIFYLFASVLAYQSYLSDDELFGLWRDYYNDSEHIEQIADTLAHDIPYYGHYPKNADPDIDFVDMVRTIHSLKGPFRVLFYRYLNRFWHRFTDTQRSCRTFALLDFARELLNKLQPSSHISDENADQFNLLQQAFEECVLSLTDEDSFLSSFESFFDIPFPHADKIYQKKTILEAFRQFKDRESIAKRFMSNYFAIVLHPDIAYPVEDVRERITNDSIELFFQGENPAILEADIAGDLIANEENQITTHMNSKNTSAYKKKPFIKKSKDKIKKKSSGIRSMASNISRLRHRLSNSF